MANSNYEKRLEQIEEAALQLNEVASESEIMGIKYAILKASPSYGDMNIVRLEKLMLNIANQYDKYDEINAILKK